MRGSAGGGLRRLPTALFIDDLFIAFFILCEKRVVFVGYPDSVASGG